MLPAWLARKFTGSASIGAPKFENSAWGRGCSKTAFLLGCASKTRSSHFFSNTFALYIKSLDHQSVVNLVMSEKEGKLTFPEYKLIYNSDNNYKMSSSAYPFLVDEKKKYQQQ